MIRFLYWKGHYNGRNRSKEAREDKGGDLLAVDEEKRIDSGDTEEGKWLNFLMDQLLGVRERQVKKQTHDLRHTQDNSDTITEMGMI